MSDERIENDEIMRADPARKGQAFALIAALIVAGVLLKLVALPALLRWLNVSDNALLLQRVALVFDGLAVLMLASAAYAGWHASRILRSNQSPPPNTWLLRDTRIVRGGAARLRGWVVMVCAVAFVVLTVYAALLPAHLQKLIDTYRSATAPSHQFAPPSAPAVPSRAPAIVPHPHHAMPSAPQAPPIAKPHG
jgi:hypothetical protein